MNDLVTCKKCSGAKEMDNYYYRGEYLINICGSCRKTPNRSFEELEMRRKAFRKLSYSYIVPGLTKLAGH